MKTPAVSALFLALASLAPAGDLLVSTAWLKENLDDPRLVLAASRRTDLPFETTPIKN